MKEKDVVVNHAIGIYHPDGHIELMGMGKRKPIFHWTTKIHKGIVTQEVWRKTYRPKCLMRRVRVIILLEPK